jgi:molecular chaperone GrpE
MKIMSARGLAAALIMAVQEPIRRIMEPTEKETTNPGLEEESKDTPESTAVDQQTDISADATAVKEEELINDLKTQLEQAKTQSSDYLNGWQRARAEFANYKKRQEELTGRLREDQQVELLKNILPILDDFDLAFANVPEEKMKSEEAWLNGFSLIQRKLQKIIAGYGVEMIDALGAFDPNLHEALTNETHPDLQEGQIIAVVRKGYRKGERILRPAQVRVAK